MRWKNIKKTGQNKFTSLQVIIEGKYHHSIHKAMANLLNHQFVRKINKVIEDMEGSATNPFDQQKFNQSWTNDLHF